MYCSICTWIAGFTKISKFSGYKMDKLQHLGAGALCCVSATPWLRARNQFYRVLPVSNPSHHGSQLNLALQKACCDPQPVCCESATSIVQKRKRICTRSGFFSRRFVYLRRFQPPRKEVLDPLETGLGFGAAAFTTGVRESRDSRPRIRHLSHLDVLGFTMTSSIFLCFSLDFLCMSE